MIKKDVMIVDRKQHIIILMKMLRTISMKRQFKDAKDGKYLIEDGKMIINKEYDKQKMWFK